MKSVHIAGSLSAFRFPVYGPDGDLLEVRARISSLQSAPRSTSSSLDWSVRHSILDTAGFSESHFDVLLRSADRLSHHHFCCDGDRWKDIL